VVLALAVFSVLKNQWLNHHQFKTEQKWKKRFSLMMMTMMI
jgi:hypothetical protein